MGIGMLERRQLQKQLQQRYKTFHNTYRRLIDAVELSQQEDRQYFNAIKIHVRGADVQQLDDQWNTLAAVHRTIQESIINQTTFIDMDNELFADGKRNRELSRATATIERNSARVTRSARIEHFWDTTNMNTAVDVLSGDYQRQRFSNKKTLSAEALNQLNVDASDVKSPEYAVAQYMFSIVDGTYEMISLMEMGYGAHEYKVKALAKVQQAVKEKHTELMKPILAAQARQQTLATYEALFTDTEITMQYLTDMTDTIVKAQSMLIDAVDVFRQAASRFDPEHANEERSIEDVDDTGEQMTEILGVMRGLSLEK